MIQSKRIVLCAALAVLFCLSAQKLYAQKVYCFLPSEFRALTIEDAIKAKNAALQPKVFADIGDFKKAVAADAPEIIITKPLVINQLEGYSIKLHAIRKGKQTENYFLLSVGKPVFPNQLAGRVVGVLDFLGKKEMKTFVNAALKSDPELTRVKKVADLLPLLTMSMVDCVFISDFFLAYMKSKSKQDFVVTPLEYKSDIGVAAMRTDDAKLVGTVQSLPKEVLTMLGVDAWK